MAQRPLWARNSSLLRLHDHTLTHQSHSVGLLWSSYQPEARPVPENTRHTHKRDCHAADGIRTCNSSIRVAAEPLRPRFHRDRPSPSWSSLSRLWGSICLRTNLDLATCTLLFGSSRHPIKNVPTTFNISFLQHTVRGSNPGGGRDFPHPSRPALGSHPASYSMGAGSLSRG